MPPRIPGLIRRAALTACACLLILAPATGRATPREAVIYPNSAQILEEASLKPAPAGNRLATANIFIPAQADPDSLVLRLPAGSKLHLADMKWKRVNPGESPEVAQVRKELDGLQSERAKLDATIQAQKARIEFWQAQTKTHTRKISEAAELAGALGEHIQKLLREKYPNEKKLEEMDRRIKETQDKLHRLTGGADRPWQVDILLAGPAQPDVAVTYSYTLAGCGWTSIYRLDAVPSESRILFTWEAEIRQSSGQDWNNVDVSLATLRRTWNIAPSDLPPWVIQPKVERRTKAARSKAAGAPVPMMMAEAAPAPAPEADNDYVQPQAEQKTSFTVWKLGRRSIPAGTAQRIAIQDESWKAAFAYLVRPGLDSRAFVRAKIELPEAREIPGGRAMYMVDGALLGKRDFSLSGKEAEIFFGSDPLITAKSTPITAQSGSQGFFGSKQTYAWAWDIAVTNGKPYPVQVRVEESRPQIRDERITVTPTLDPAPGETTPDKYVWTLDVPAASERTIKEKISLEAPKDMHLDLGWREK